MKIIPVIITVIVCALYLILICINFKDWTKESLPEKCGKLLFINLVFVSPFVGTIAAILVDVSFFANAYGHDVHLGVAGVTLAPWLISFIWKCRQVLRNISQDEM